MKNLLFVVLLAIPSSLFAQEHEIPMTADEDSGTSGDMREKSNEWMIPPSNTANIGLKLESITTTEDLSQITGDDQLKLTDVALLRLAGNYSAAEVAQIFAHAAILPKQTSNMTESVFQNAGLGLKLGLAKRIAGKLAVKGGMTSGKNVYGRGSVGIESRFKLERYVRISGGLGASYFSILGNDDARFVETDIGLEIGFYERRSGGLWLGADYHIPVWSIDRSFSHDPKNRLNLGLGGVFTFIDHWDLYATYTFIDRGDLEEPSSLLPILDGGFDQRKLSFGITYRINGNPD